MQQRNVFIYHMISSFNLILFFLGLCQVLGVENNVNLEFGLPRAEYSFGENNFKSLQLYSTMPEFFAGKKSGNLDSSIKVLFTEFKKERN